MSRFVWLAVALSLPAAAWAQQDSAEYSSSLAPVAVAAEASPTRIDGPIERAPNRAFRSVALEFKVGVAGIGFDLGTPLGSRVNLRGGAQFFDHTLNPNANGLQTLGDLTLQNVQVSVDLFPFKKSSFHISPGMTLHNDNHLFSSIFVRPGNTFSLGDQDYISDPNNPITGYSRFKLGNTTAPRLTVGFGNMLPKHGSRFSVPFEVGFQYISSPSLDLHLYGNACDGSGNCGDINASDGPQNLASEVQMLNQDISSLRFFPVLSIGLSYKFGR